MSFASVAGPMPATPAPSVSRVRAWYVVLMLTLLYIVSFVDRIILSLLMTPVAAEFGVSDAHLGLVVGAGFAIVYSICGIPLAYWIDARRRQPIVVAGVMLWSLATIASGFSTSIVQLALARCGVAIGEAVLMPAAISMIADLFLPHRRGAPIAVFGSIGAIMAGGAWIIGAGAVDLANNFSGLSGLSPWRMVMIVVGAPGVLLGLIFLFTVAEPDRGAASADDPRDGATMAAFARYLGRAWTFFVPLFLGIACFGAYTYGTLTWLPTSLVRAHGFSPQSAGYAAGVTCGAAMIIGAVLWPNIANRFGRRALANGPVSALLASGILAFGPMTLGPFSASPATALLAAAWSMGCLISLSMLPAQTIQLCCPSRMRGKFMAVLLLTHGIFGFSAGAFFVPVLGEAVSAGVVTIGRGLGVLGAIVGPLGGLFLAIALIRLNTLRKDGVIEA